MNLTQLRVKIEKALLGVSLDDVYDRISDLNQSIDNLSGRLEERLAKLRKEMQTGDGASSDPRDGLYIIEDECIGCRLCEDIAPETFRMRDDGIAEVYNTRGSDMDCIKEAMESCGSACIRLV